MKKLHLNKGFTLMETMVTIVIIGILSSVAVPKFSFVIEKTRSAEGIQTLTALRGAQELYFQENGVYATDLNQLDIDLVNIQNFAALGNADIDSDPAAIAQTTRNDGTYTYIFTIDNTGTIFCADNGSPANTCSKLGCTGGVGSDECN